MPFLDSDVGNETCSASGILRLFLPCGLMYLMLVHVDSLCWVIDVLLNPKSYPLVL